MTCDPFYIHGWLQSQAEEARQQFWVDLLFTQPAEDLTFIAKSVHRIQSYHRVKSGEVPNQAVLDQVSVQDVRMELSLKNAYDGEHRAHHFHLIYIGVLVGLFRIKNICFNYSRSVKVSRSEPFLVLAAALRSCLELSHTRIPEQSKSMSEIWR